MLPAWTDLSVIPIISFCLLFFSVCSIWWDFSVFCFVLVLELCLVFLFSTLQITLYVWIVFWVLLRNHLPVPAVQVAVVRWFLCIHRHFLRSQDITKIFKELESYCYYISVHTYTTYFAFAFQWLASVSSFDMKSTSFYRFLRRTILNLPFYDNVSTWRCLSFLPSFPFLFFFAPVALARIFCVILNKGLGL